MFSQILKELRPPTGKANAHSFGSFYAQEMDFMIEGYELERDK